MGLSEDIYGDGWDPAKTLADDATGVKLRELLGILGQNRAKLKSALDRGVPPDEFKSGQALLAGYDAAVRGLEAAWTREHGA